VRRLLPKRKRGWALWIVSAFFISVLVACGPTKLTISRANLKPNGFAASPVLAAKATSLLEWEENIRPRLKLELQQQVFGFLPDASSTKIIDRKVIAETAYGDKASIEEYTLTATAVFNGQAATTRPFKLVVVTPKGAVAPVPVIMLQSFCPNHNTVQHSGVSKPAGNGFSCDGEGFMGNVMGYVFGRYIATPPMEMILEHGYALAALYPSEFVPDRSERGLAELKALSVGHTDDQTRWGAIAAWGWGFSRAIDALEQDERFAKDGFVTYGHSRYGKSALVAAAFDNRVGAVMSHQSGTGGASLNKYKKGESVGEITKIFPHWFSRSYAGYAGHEQDMTTDQHALLALIAPRPLFLGNARRDVWSDPNGAFRAAQAASSAYKIYGKQGLTQAKLSDFTPGADIAFWIRPGTHGVVKEDWPAFLEFMDAHYK
jgi:(4-O-methyl)-D-glucuronate---lignin esterase